MTKTLLLLATVLAASCSANATNESSAFEIERLDATVMSLWSDGKHVFLVGRIDPQRGMVDQWSATNRQRMDAAPQSFVTGSSPTDVWTSGQAGVLHFQGESWQHPIEIAPLPGGTLHGALALPGEVWFAGDVAYANSEGRTVSGTLFRVRDRIEAIDPLLSGSLRGVVGTSGSDIWVFGDGGVAHFDGEAWSRKSEASFVAQGFARAPNDVWFVGTGYRVVHWDGAALRSVDVSMHDEAPSEADGFRAVWANAREVWLGGDHGVLVRGDGERWTAVDTGGRDVLAIGGTERVTWFGGPAYVGRVANDAR